MTTRTVATPQQLSHTQHEHQREPDQNEQFDPARHTGGRVLEQV
ncbi:hypothetical protein [Deinococcus aquatilis]|nr:hypothetical protein [Deinococcus aquatilis]